MRSSERKSMGSRICKRVHMHVPRISFPMICNIVSGQMEKTQNIMIHVGGLWYAFHCVHVHCVHWLGKSGLEIKYKGVVDTLKVRNCEAKYKWRDFLRSPSLISIYFSAQNRSSFMVSGKVYFLLLLISWFFYMHRNPRVCLVIICLSSFPFPLSCLTPQPFSWKWGWIEQRCVVPYLSQHTERNSQLCTDCITPLDESCFLPLDGANRVWKQNMII